MKFSTREDIEAPIDEVFARITDFSGFERQAIRRSADVRRKDDGPVRVGSNWDVAFTFRGKDRQMNFKLTAMEQNQSIEVVSLGSGIVGTTTAELVALSPRRTRIVTAIELTAKSIPARLMLQSMKLAKGNLTKRFKKRVAEFALDVEERYRAKS